MSCSSTQFEFQIGGSGVLPLSVRDVNGAPVDADATPTITAMTLNGVGVDETNAAYAVSVVQVQDDTPAAVTGEYQITFDPSAFAAGDTIQFYVQAAVNAVTLKTVKSALVFDSETSRPVLC